MSDATGDSQGSIQASHVTAPESMHRRNGGYFGVRVADAQETVDRAKAYAEHNDLSPCGKKLSTSTARALAITLVPLLVRKGSVRVVYPRVYCDRQELLVATEDGFTIEDKRVLLRVLRNNSPMRGVVRDAINEGQLREALAWVTA